MPFADTRLDLTLGCMGLDYTRLSVALTMTFIEHLTAIQRRVASVLSTIGTVKAALVRHCISVHAFVARSVEMLIWLVKINKRTPAQQRLLVSVPTSEAL